MFFSIVIPIYNSEKTIGRCLDSVSAQLCDDYEVIMIDDGSSDGGPEICLKYAEKDSRFRYFRQDNSGVSETRNHGIDQATGEFIVFLDSDDCYSPSYLQTFRQLIRQNPDCDHFWCGYRTVSNSSRSNGIITKLAGKDEIVVSDRREIMSLYEADLLAPLWNKAFRAELIRTHKIRMRKDLSLGEDLLFVLDYFEAASDTRILMANEALYDYYCFSSDSLNRKYRPDLMAIYRELIDGISVHIRRWDLDQEQMAKYYSAVYHMLLRGMRNTFHKNNTASRSKKLRNCDAVLRSEEFREAVKNADCHINPLYRAAYATGRYSLVQLAVSVSALRRKKLSGKRRKT